MLSGHGRYLADVTLPGLLQAAFVRSEVARGTVTGLDVEAARRLPGVVAVYTAADLNPGAGPLWATLYEGAPGPPLRPLAAGDVRFVGDAVALVIAENRYLAEDAAELVELDIEAGPAVVDLRRAASDEVVVHPELGTNIGGRADTLDDAAWAAVTAAAALVVTRTFHQGRATNVPMEARGVVADWDPWTPRLQVWASTQNPHELRVAYARLLGIGEQHVRVFAGDVGGGFGMKLFVTPEEACVVLAAHRLGRPVQWVEDRRENLLAAGHARHDEATITVAVAADGELLGMRMDHLEDVGAFPVGGTASSTSSIRRLLPGPYKVATAQYSGRAVYTNTCGRTAYRGPWVMETTVREQMLDHVARELGMDPLALRLRNVVQAADLPYDTGTGNVYRCVTPAETIEQAAELIGYDQFRVTQADARRAGRCVGIGLAAFIEPTGMGAGMLGTDQATMRVEPSGVVNVYMGTGSTGNSIETTIPQVVAEYLGCALEDVVFHQGDTDSAPWGHGTGGSRSAVVAGGAARAAALELRTKVLRVAAELLEAAPDDLELTASVVSVRGTPSRTVTLSQVAAMVYRRPESLPADIDQGLEVALRYRPRDPYTWSNACHACICEIDTDTGVVDLQRFVVSEDCGVMINPMVVEGQIAGGVAQGIGGALLEHFVYDADGTPATTTFLDYLLPTAMDVPDIEVGHIETRSNSLGGYKGMGEGGAIASPAAVANAVNDALSHLGVQVAQFPMTPTRVLDAIDSAG